jgi:DNA-binding NarL/FixJ family response regulator
MVRKLLSNEVPLAIAKSKPTEALTPRETEVLKLIVQGYTNRQIGEELSISIRTAESHRANLSDKLGLHNRVELVRFAREHGLIE